MLNKLIAIAAVSLMAFSGRICAAPAAGMPQQPLPFKMNGIIEPVIPDREVSVADFGAVGDGHTLCTSAFARAVESLCSQGGGRLNVPRGVWLTGPIELKSHIELHLCEGALIQATTDRQAYPLVKMPVGNMEARLCMSPITAVGAEHIAITGSGIIDGGGQAWRPVKRMKTTADQWEALCRTGATSPDGKTWYPSEEIRDLSVDRTTLNQARATGDTALWTKLHDYLRPRLVTLVSCRCVLLEGVTFQNSPMWNIHPQLCRNVIIRGITVRNPWYAQNGDGIDLESCSDCLVTRCSLDVGDDGLCLKSGRDKAGRDRGVATERVVITDCKVYHGHGGFVVGSEMSGGVRDIYVSNCTFSGTDCGLRFKSTRGRGGVVERIWIDGIQMSAIAGDGLTFDLYYGGGERTLGPNGAAKAKPVDETTPCFRDIHINNVVCDGAKRAMYIGGLPEMPVSNLAVSRSAFTADTGVTINEADGITFSAVSIWPKQGDKITQGEGVAHLEIRN